jgi:hypothetical protein
MKRDADEKQLLESVERGEWKSAGSGKRERARYSPRSTATGEVRIREMCLQPGRCQQHRPAR